MAKKEKKAENKEQVVGTGQVRKQFPPIYNVVSKGVTIEWTDKLSEASAAYKDANAPKFIYRINGNDVGCVSAAY